MKKIIISILLILTVIGWMSLIFSMSAEPADVSTATSGNTIRRILDIFYPDFKNMSGQEQQGIIDSCQHFVRKLAHFSIYTVLGMLLSVNAVYHFKNNRLRTLLPISAGVLYAVSDEIHQTYVPGRSGQISDVLLDSAGVLLGCSVVLLTIIFIKQIRRKRQ